MTGYQQGIICLSGSRPEPGRIVVRNIDRHYVDALAPLSTRTRPYYQQRDRDGRPGYWVLKLRGELPTLSDVADWSGFCRAFVELQGRLDTQRIRKPSGVVSERLRLRIWGDPASLTAIMAVLPAQEKTIQSCHTNTGSTSALYYQSKAEIADILNYINGYPRNEDIWVRWSATCTVAGSEIRRASVTIPSAGPIA